MRIAVGQLSQESNKFNPLPTTYADFEAFGICAGTEMLGRFAHTNELGGFIQALQAWPERPEIVGLMRLAAWPSGPADAATFKMRMERMRPLNWTPDPPFPILRFPEGVVLSPV